MLLLELTVSSFSIRLNPKMLLYRGLSLITVPRKASHTNTLVHCLSWCSLFRNTWTMATKDSDAASMDTTTSLKRTRPGGSPQNLSQSKKTKKKVGVSVQFV